MQFSNSKKTRKTLKPYVKDPKKMQRLQDYLVLQGFANSDDRSPKRKNPSIELSTPRSNIKLSENKDSPSEKCGDTSDSSLSDYCFEDRSKADNYANTSLRNIYMKSSSPQVPLTTREDDQENSVIAEANINKFSRKKKKVKPNFEDIITKNKSFLLQKSSVKFCDVGGLNVTFKEITLLLLRLRHPVIYQNIGDEIPPRGYLLHGPPGCGKTLIARAVAGELNLPFIEVAATELVSGISGESESKIRELFEGAINSAPCILFIDEIDSITPKRETAQKEMEKRIVSQLLKCMDDLNSNRSCSGVMVIGATNRPQSLDPALRRAGRFDREISIGIPDENARYEILEIFCNKLRLSPEVDLRWLARNTPGYVGADLRAIITEAMNNVIKRNLHQLVSSESNSSSDRSSVMLWLETVKGLKDEQLGDILLEVQDFEAAIRIYVPSAKKEGFATIPNVTWKDVGALDQVKEEIQKSFLWPIKYRSKFEEYHISFTTGILMYGPKGCGKTLLAKALANECSVNFLSVKGPELLNMYVGESERAVRECFQRARNSAPCVIFFDEIDALCPTRGNSNENPVTERVVNQLLTEIDGIEGQKQIFVIGATNRPNSIDSAMLRPGRLEKQIFVGPPNETDRCNILQTITKNGTQPKLAADVSLVELSCDERCVGFSGADLKSLVREASMIALEEVITDSDKVDFEVKLRHFDYAFTKVEPSISERDFFSFKKNKKKVVSKSVQYSINDCDT